MKGAGTALREYVDTRARESTISPLQENAFTTTATAITDLRILAFLHLHRHVYALPVVIGGS